MERRFGIELEVVGINRQTALAALGAVGINVVNENYNHTTRVYWKIVPDRSVQNGFEVVSPILQGEAGLEEAIAVAEALADAGASVNRSCGFHVHFDAAALSVADLKVIVRRYAAHEAEIDAFMPPSRRGDANTYCAPLADFLTPNFDAATTYQELTRSQPSRYFKVNLQSFHRHGSIEFRHHSGTVNASKIGNWIRFLAEFIDQCKRQSLFTAQSVETPAFSGVQGRLFEMLVEHGTVLLSTMCENFGWQEHTARAAITRLRRAGMCISPVKMNGRSAYRLNESRTSIVSQVDSLWTGISERIIRFYQRRAAVLAAVV